MEAPTASLLVRQQGEALVVRVDGRATMRQAPALRRLAELCPVRGVRELLIDLHACTYLDSTFLGTLLCLQRVAGCWRNGRYALIAPSPECRAALRQLGLLDVLTIQEVAPDGGSDWTLLDEDSGDLGMLKANVIQAHQALAGIPGESGEEFKRVAECLAGEQP
jgi:anti-anti-sigma factor